MSLPADVTEVMNLFPSIYLLFHRRASAKRWRPTAQMMGLLNHLCHAGPLTVGEMARHVGRAQSVISQMVEPLVKRGLLDRMRDAKDGRRVLVWLTPQGQTWMEEERQVLSAELLRTALARMTKEQREHLLDGMRALVAAAPSPHPAARGETT